MRKPYQSPGRMKTHPTTILPRSGIELTTSPPHTVASNMGKKKGISRHYHLKSGYTEFGVV